MMWAATFPLIFVNKIWGEKFMITICNALLGEHGAFYRQFEFLEGLAKGNSSLAVLVNVTRPIADALISHAELENEILFSELDSVMGPSGPASVMRFDHEEIDSGFKNLIETGDLKEF